MLVVATETSVSAPEQLRLALAKQRGAAADLARDLDVDPSLVTRWGTGDRKPNTRQRVLLEDRFGIPLLSWDEAPKVDSDEGSPAA